MNSARTVVRSEAAQLPVVAQFLREFWAAAGLPAAEAHPFELALEEIFMNVVMHGTPGGNPVRVEVSLALSGAGLAMTIADDGPEFDPLSLPAPDTEAPLAERRVGGHGVSLVRQMMDTVTYRRAAERNQLRMTKRLSL